MFWRGIRIDFNSLEILSMNAVWMESELKGIDIECGDMLDMCCLYDV